MAILADRVRGESAIMFGDRPFRRVPLILIGATVFATLFEAVWLLAEYVTGGDFSLTLESIAFFCVAFVGYVCVALLIRRS